MAAETTSAISELPLFQELDWDFKRQTFQYGPNGAHIVVTGNEALKIWIRKALMVERYRFRAYFDDYGAELERFIGTVPNDTAAGNQVFDYVREALLVNPYITEVTNISAVQEEKQIILTIAVQTVYGNTRIGIEV